MKHLFIINPAAGSRDRTKFYSDLIREVCTKRELDFSIAISGAPGHCTTLARQAAQSGEEIRIYACGGDGTLNEVVAGAAGYPNAAISVLSCGSGNDFTKVFSAPEAFRDLERLLDCEEVTFDLIRCNDDLSLNICSVGLDARIATDVARYKRLPLISGFRAYAVSTLVNVIRGVGEHYVIHLGDEVIDADQTMICVCNGRYYGGGFNPVPEADPADGLLDVLIVKKVSRLKVAGVVGKFKNGRHREMADLMRHERVKELKILCDKPSTVNLDGEMRVAQEVTFRVAEEKIRFFYPKGLVWKNPEPVTV